MTKKQIKTLEIITGSFKTCSCKQCKKDTKALEAALKELKKKGKRNENRIE